MSLVQILGLLLALSLAGNVWLTHTYLGVRDDLTVATGARDQARGAATMCSDATEALQDQATQRASENKALRAAATAKSTQLDAAAQQELATPASVPGDDCKSAVDRAQRWLAKRSTP